MRQSVAVITVSLVAAIRAMASNPALPVGGEFQVNTHTVDMQNSPSISADAAGDFVVVWTSYFQDGNDYGVFGQRFSSSGASLGTEFQVNTTTAASQGGSFANSNVSSAADGSFVVVWTSYDGDGEGIFGQRYDDTSGASGGEFQVNVGTVGGQIYPFVASAPNGDFVVAWTDLSDRDGMQYGVFARRYDSSGAALGVEFQLSTYTVARQGELGARVAVDGSGNFVAVWTSGTQDGSGRGVFGRRFDGTGTGLGTEFQVNGFTITDQDQPNIASDPSGNFVVAWRSFGQDGSACSVQGRRFDSSANPLGGEFQVNSYTFLCQVPFRQAAFMDADGRFAIVWTDQSLFGDGNGSHVAGQQYAPDGSPIGGEFQINSYTLSDQGLAAVAGSSNGDFVVAWQSYGQDGFYRGIFAQRFQAGTLATETPTPTPTAIPSGECPATVDGGCTTGFAKGALLVKEDVAGKEKLIAKMVKGPALAQTDLGNPLSPSGTVYSLCVYDDAGNLAGGTPASVIVDRAGDTCGSGPCWSAVGGDPPGGKGYKYLDTALASDGVSKILYKGGAAGKSKAIVKGGGSNLPNGIAAALQSAAFATVQLRASDGICLSLTVDDVKKHTAGFFKAKFAAP